MINLEIFPKNVQEVFDFWFHGDILCEPYKRDLPSELLIRDINAAIELYTNQDVEPPLYFLEDIIDEAKGDIPYFTDNQKELTKSLALLMEFYHQIDRNIIVDRIKNIQHAINANNYIIDLLSDSINGHLYTIAKSRLLLADSHPFLEKLFFVLKNQGYPCAWKGEENCYNGDFVIYSR